MWDRQYWYVARQSYRDQRRAARQAYRDARRNYRHNYYRRNPFLGFLLFMLIAFMIWHGLGFLFPLLILGGAFYIARRLRHSGMVGPGSSTYLGSNNNYQQPNQYYQPSQQPHPYDQPNQYYQPPVSSEPLYQPYDQGYQAPVQNEQQEVANPYQSNPYESASTQYEEPQAQYPQEMPPMA